VSSNFEGLKFAMMTYQADQATGLGKLPLNGMTFSLRQSYTVTATREALTTSELCMSRADECAGITQNCLIQDLNTTESGSSCVPLLDGASCGLLGDKACSKGYCGGGSLPADSTTLGSMSCNTLP
jgi:hypothetical protein